MTKIPVNSTSILASNSRLAIEKSVEIKSGSVFHYSVKLWYWVLFLLVAWWSWNTRHFLDNEGNQLVSLSMSCWRIFTSVNHHFGGVLEKRKHVKLLAHPILFHQWGAPCQRAWGENQFPSGRNWTPFSLLLSVFIFVVLLAFFSMLSTSLLYSPCHMIKIDGDIQYSCTQHKKIQVWASTFV